MKTSEIVPSNQQLVKIGEKLSRKIQQSGGISNSIKTEIEKETLYT